MTETFPWNPETKAFSAARVYDKVGILTLLALLTGTISYLADNPALIILGFVAGFGLSLLGLFKPATAKVAAPLYALAEGLALGGITAYYATTSGSGIIPMAIIFTGGIFLGALAVFRTGLIKVTPKFMAMTMMAAAGFLLVLIAVALGLPVPVFSGSSGPLIFGIFGVGIGVLFLFMDFNYVQVAEQRRFPAEGEWFGALLLMTSLVFVYFQVLRILGRRR